MQNALQMQNIFLEISNVRLSLCLKLMRRSVLSSSCLCFLMDSEAQDKGLAGICAFFLLHSVSVQVFSILVPNLMLLRLH